MKVKLLLRRAAAGTLCLFLCLAALTGPAHAAMGPIDDVERNCSLTVTYLHTGKNVRLYRVASVNEYAGFTPEGKFENILKGLSDETLKDLNKIGSAEKWRALASSLDLEILKRDDVEAFESTKTRDVNDAAVASFNGLPQGLYLVVSERYSVTERQDNGTAQTVWYSATPYLVCLPSWSEDEWKYDVVMDASGKMAEAAEGKTGIKVVKLWLDSKGNALEDHPNSVTVNLLCDGKIYDTVVLNESGWSKVWEVDNAHRWDVEEEPVNGYSASVKSNDGRNFIIENRRRTSGGNDPPRDDGGNNPPGGDTEITIEEPDVPLSVPPIEDIEEPPEEIEIEDPDVPLGDLPQTGQLWWPVPMLAVVGTFLLLLGWGRNRRGRYDRE